MRTIDTHYGTVYVGRQEELFTHTTECLAEIARTRMGPFIVGLTGGSTPAAFYRWVVEHAALSDNVRAHAIWSVSDERHVPVTSAESNFGNAVRAMLSPLGVPEDRQVAWPVNLPPEEAARRFEDAWDLRFGGKQSFDLCLMGMGDDGHTLSLFPGSPLLKDDGGNKFAAVDVPGKGWRLTLTPTGLERCRRVLITVQGEAKAERVKAVLDSEPGAYPVQIVARLKDRVSWLMNEAAASAIA